MRFFLLKYLTYICNKINYMLSKKKVFDLSKYQKQIYYREMLLYISILLIAISTFELSFHYYDAEYTIANNVLYYIVLLACLITTTLAIIFTSMLLSIISNPSKKIKIHNGFDNFVIFNSNDDINGEKYSYTFRRFLTCSEHSSKYSTINNLEYYVSVSDFLMKMYNSMCEETRIEPKYHRVIDYKFK